MTKNNANEWTKYNISFCTSLETVIEIIEDALSYGYEFKIENHNLYFREIVE